MKFIPRLAKYKARTVGSNGPGLKVKLTKPLVLFPARFLTIALPRQGFLHPALLARFQIVGMPLNFLNNVLLLDLPFEPAQGVFKRFALLQPNFGQV